MIAFDHIAIAAPTLASGAAHLNAATGITPAMGGEHPLMGTHNMLTSLGPDTFAEVIAINPDAPKPVHKRWFDLDNPNLISPRLHAWLLRTDDIEGAIDTAAALGIDMGEPVALTRGDLKWRFTVRKDGKIPLNGIAPLILQWDTDGPHPASRMTDQGLRLNSLSIFTPHADQLTKLLTALGLKDLPTITQFETPRLTAHLSINGKQVALS